MEWAYSLRVPFAEAAATHSTLVKNFSLSRMVIICTFCFDFLAGEGRGEGTGLYPKHHF